MFKKNLELIFCAMFLFGFSTSVFCEDNILVQEIDVLEAQDDSLDENLTYTTDFEENDVFEEESDVIDDEDLDFSDLDLDSLDDGEDSEISFADKAGFALTYLKYKASEHIKENAKLYLAGIILVGSAATAGVYYKFIKKS